MLRSGPRVVPGVILGLGSEKSEQELFLLGGKWGLWVTMPVFAVSCLAPHRPAQLRPP